MAIREIWDDYEGCYSGYKVVPDSWKAKIDGDIEEISLLSGRKFYVSFDVEITDCENELDWQFDWNNVIATDESNNDIYDYQENINLLTKDEEEEMFKKIESYLYLDYEKNKKIEWECA